MLCSSSVSSLPRKFFSLSSCFSIACALTLCFGWVCYAHRLQLKGQFKSLFLSLCHRIVSRKKQNSNPYVGRGSFAAFASVKPAESFFERLMVRV